MDTTNKLHLVQQLEGTQTIKSVMSILGTTKDKAIHTIHKLREQGYIKTHKRSDQTRVYQISISNRLGGKNPYDLINSNSPIKISPPGDHMIYGAEQTTEDAIIFALKTKSLRTILASIGSYRRIDDWQKLYRLAKQNNLQRQVGAIYDLSRTIIPKIRRMPQRFRKYAAPKPQQKFEYTIQGLRSKDVQEIERRWKVYLPFNKSDLKEYHDLN